uniref:Uncharacterized protein n=1 Tax=Timema bartmani TaxID=61472 RepID=A0A7R9I6H2_9NEOP|nr:unnamed protein product [Timema bartmani]
MYILLQTILDSLASFWYGCRECCLVKERQRVVALHLYYRRAQEQEESDRKPDGRHALRDRSGEDLSGGFTSESIIFFGSKMASPSYTDLLGYADIKEQSFVDALEVKTTNKNIWYRQHQYPEENHEDISSHPVGGFVTQYFNLFLPDFVLNFFCSDIGHFGKYTFLPKCPGMGKSPAHRKSETQPSAKVAQQGLNESVLKELSLAKARGSEPTFVWRESGKPPNQDANIDTPVLTSLAQHKTSALAYYAIESMQSSGTNCVVNSWYTPHSGVLLKSPHRTMETRFSVL